MLKVVFILIYTLCIKIFTLLVLGLGLLDFHNIFYFLIFVMFLPEMGFALSKGFRNWLKNGIEDSDQKFNREDFNSLLRHYSTLWCIRLYVLFGLLEAFHGIQVRETFINGSLAGAFGIEVIGFVFKNKSNNGSSTDK